MFGIPQNAKSTAALCSLALAASVLFAPGAFAMAQQTPLAQDPGACAVGTTWRAVMPDNMIATLQCPRALGAKQPQMVSTHPFGARAAPAAVAYAPRAREPLYTGSIGHAAPAATRQGRMEMVSGPGACRPGDYWMTHNWNNDPAYDTPMSCPG